MSAILFSRQYIDKRNPQDGADCATQVAALLAAEGIDCGPASVGGELTIDGGASSTAYSSSTTLDAGGA